MFLALLGMCETNAMKAYRNTVGPITRYEWLVLLSEKLINNPFIGEEDGSDDDGAAGGAGASSSRGKCGNLEYHNHVTKC